MTLLMFLMQGAVGIQVTGSKFGFAPYVSRVVTGSAADPYKEVSVYSFRQLNNSLALIMTQSPHKRLISLRSC